ncbi:unnamed protein product, partial [marine sediment metagenome]
DLESKRFNTEEFFASRTVSFATDSVDWWTIDNYKGTSYVVTTKEVAAGDADKRLFKGHDTINIPLALANRKEGLNAVETAVKAVASVADDVINFFGGNSRLADKVTARVGMLKTSDNVHTVPKLVYMVGGKIPSNNREVFSAKSLYNNYINEKSFVANNFGNQYELHDSVSPVPFGFENFLELNTSNVFQTWDDRTGKVDSFKWNMGRDFAEMNFRIKNIYTKNLEEVTVEPE